jgi:putrescine transport system substrate-binding protein
MKHAMRACGLAVLAAAGLAMMPPGAMAQEKVVNVYNWADYIGETTIADFEKETGIKVNYDHYDSSEAAEAKVIAGSSGYDVVVIASRNLQTFLPAKVLQKLDRAKLPGWSHLDPEMLRILSSTDPGNEYAMPYMWGSTGVTYNTEAVDALVPNAPYDSMDMLLKPELAEKIAGCGINIIDSQANVVPMVLAHLGKDPQSQEPQDLEAVVEAFKPVRQHFKSFDNNNYTAQLLNKELCATMNWAGDYATALARAKEANVDIKLRYEVPKSGSPVWFDVLVVLADSKNVDNAHAFLDYMLRPEVIAAATNFVNYANANKDATPLVKKAITGNPAIYPDEAVRKRLWLQKPASPEYERLRTDAWNRIRTGS